MGKRCQLRGNGGPVLGQVIALGERDMTLGRDLANDAVIADSEVSRTHARLSYRNEEHLVQDLKSTNGTWINGRPVTGPVRLALGDMLTLGKTSVFVYELVPESELDTSREPEDSGDLVESTMAMPAFPEAVHEARRLIKPASPSPDQAALAEQAARSAAAPPETEVSSGRSFYQKYVSCLQAGVLQELLSLYYPEATLLSVDRAITGTAGIAQFFGQYFGGLGGLNAEPAGKFVEGVDSFLSETRLESPEVIARVQDMFVLKDGKATHHFISVGEARSKRA